MAVDVCFPTYFTKTDHDYIEFMLLRICSDITSVKLPQLCLWSCSDCRNDLHPCMYERSDTTDRLYKTFNSVLIAFIENTFMWYRTSLWLQSTILLVKKKKSLCRQLHKEMLRCQLQPIKQNRYVLLRALAWQENHVWPIAQLGRNHLLFNFYVVLQLFKIKS